MRSRRATATRAAPPQMTAIPDIIMIAEASPTARGGLERRGLNIEPSSLPKVRVENNTSETEPVDVRFPNLGGPDDPNDPQPQMARAGPSGYRRKVRFLE
jgi:hypothetical protein